MNELVSVVIPTYKRSVEIVLRAVESALNQTYKNLEILVVNDCPEDKELERKLRNALENIQIKKIKYICLEKNSRSMQS